MSNCSQRGDRVGLGDVGLGEAQHGAQPVAQVVLHLGHQLGAAVAEGQLPVHRQLLAAFQLGHRALLALHRVGTALGATEGVELAVPARGELVGDGPGVGEYGVPQRRVDPGGDAVAQELGELRHTGGHAERLVGAAPAGVAHGRGHRQQRDGRRVQVGRSQPVSVALLDVAPARKYVDLADDAGHRQSLRPDPGQRVQLGLVVLLARVRDEQHHVRGAGFRHLAGPEASRGVQVDRPRQPGRILSEHADQGARALARPTQHGDTQLPTGQPLAGRAEPLGQLGPVGRGDQPVERLEQAGQLRAGGQVGGLRRDRHR
ncbi:MAG TPA: hypothetical protein VGM60_20375 [Pseudonocardia sp.]|uniref:hypothetical protein n=1 Tax=Pseudonocardia sp. TaxID=60912 RepID=UPI002F3E7B6E